MEAKQHVTKKQWITENMKKKIKNLHRDKG